MGALRGKVKMVMLSSPTHEQGVDVALVHQARLCQDDPKKYDKFITTEIMSR
jgi:hypothetical protein